MTPHRDHGRGTLIIDRRFPRVGRIKRASGTTERTIFKAYNSMLDALWAMGRVDTLRAIQDGTLHIAEVWASYRLGHLNELPSPETLKPLRPAWEQWMDTTEVSKSYQRDRGHAIDRLDAGTKQTVEVL